MKKTLPIALALGLAFSVPPLQLGQVQAEEVFSDITYEHPYYHDINFLIEKGVISTDKDTFNAGRIVSREEVAVMVAKAVGLDGTPRATKFKDVPKSNPNSGYIQSAVEAGIISGYRDRTFKPKANVTRGHMAAFIARAFSLPTGTKTFKDVSKGNTAYESVKQLAAAGITIGYEDGTFRPNNSLSRGHISTFLARAIKYEGGYDTIHDLKPYSIRYNDLIFGGGWGKSETFSVRQKKFISSSNIRIDTAMDSVEYIIDGKYDSFTASFAVDDISDKGAYGELVIYGDGEILFEIELKRGEKPVEINLPLNKVDTLEFQFDGGFERYIQLYDIKFHK